MRISKILILFLFIFPALASISSANENSFEIRGAGGFASWSFENVNPVFDDNGDLSIRGAAPARMISPPGLNIPSGSNVIRLRMITKRDGICVLSLGMTDGRVILKRFRIKGNRGEGAAPSDYNIPLGDVLPPGETVNGLMVSFIGSRVVDLKIEFIRLYEPTSYELAGVFWKEFWTPDFIDGWTISYAATPTVDSIPSPAILYFFLAPVSGVFVYFISRKAGLSRDTVFKALIYSFLVCGAVLAARMDYNWLSIWKDEFGKLYGKDVDERVLNVNNRDYDDFMRFVRFIKESVPPGKKVGPAVLPRGNPLESLVRYYVLPVRTSSSPDYLWVFGDSDVYIDPATGALMRSEKVIADRARLHAVFPGNEKIAIYEVLK